ncbi:TauD/TfdA family dioxygenase [Alcaligenaceae bacterium LF4-65]|jgi:taurine dioxygenase|uniref:TauD/TfdA family dioxygenase n=1 Tax=Zwartia hollandica TaxID=324606 RepID=A0A953T5B4_9BURK|nr:TauD/TfdA family dioxygenase [Zwartia hollandica]MBZ1350707.1 TauD/TfdA family dioxygenase [Zwartia hollandica]
MIIEPNSVTLGARVLELDLSSTLKESQVDALMRALGQHGVLEFPEQALTTTDLKSFSERFGQLYISPGGRAQAKGHPEVMILSNMTKDGQALGLKDAGQSWHTDMSYSKTIALANILYGKTIPHRDGRPLGATQFRDMHAAYEDLPLALKKTLETKTITHDFNKFWEMMRARPGSTRPALSEQERQARPPATHPAFLTHPITGKKVLYANPGYAIRINDLSEEESSATLEFLFEHQLQDKYLYTYQWKKNSLLMWDNIGTTHNAVADYEPHEHRYIERCQVMATRLFGPNGTTQPIMFPSGVTL